MSHGLAHNGTSTAFEARAPTDSYSSQANGQAARWASKPAAKRHRRPGGRPGRPGLPGRPRQPRRPGPGQAGGRPGKPSCARGCQVCPQLALAEAPACRGRSGPRFGRPGRSLRKGLLQEGQLETKMSLRCSTASPLLVRRLSGNLLGSTYKDSKTTHFEDPLPKQHLAQALNEAAAGWRTEATPRRQSSTPSMATWAPESAKAEEVTYDTHIASSVGKGGEGGRARDRGEREGERKREEEGGRGREKENFTWQSTVRHLQPVICCWNVRDVMSLAVCHAMQNENKQGPILMISSRICST